MLVKYELVPIHVDNIAIHFDSNLDSQQTLPHVQKIVVHLQSSFVRNALF